MAAASGANPSALQQVQQVMDQVYGSWGPGEAWEPKPFAENRHMGRYLWTDAFGVVNYLGLYQETRDERFLSQARALVDTVHDTLGRTRDGRHRLGSATHDHPTRAGLRIGKEHPEGHPDGDGQYFHYLTKWMFALTTMAAATRDTRYLSWAIEMAEGVHDAFLFSRGDSGRKALAWKMSIDLSRPAVASTGNLDPYDGLVTYTLMQEAAVRLGLAGSDPSSPPPLQRQVSDMRQMVMERYKSYSSGDPLDLGESLWLSHWRLQPDADDGPAAGGAAGGAGGGPAAAAGAEVWAAHVARTALECLGELVDEGHFIGRVGRRLAFREFGTSLGLQAVMSVWPKLPHAEKWRSHVSHIHTTWSTRLYDRDADITPVMYCSSVLPGLWLRGGWQRMMAAAAAPAAAGE